MSGHNLWVAIGETFLRKQHCSKFAHSIDSKHIVLHLELLTCFSLVNSFSAANSSPSLPAQDSIRLSLREILSPQATEHRCCVFS